MKAFAVLLVTIVAVNAGSMRIVRQTGGWPAPPSPTTPGWGQPPPPAATLTNINLDGALAAVGSGLAGENHSDNVQVIGAGGWGPNAELVISSSGVSDVVQYGSILQATDQNAQSASGLNLISVSQLAGGSEGQSLDALGVGISNQQSGSSAANGEGASAAAGDTVIQVLPIASSMGMAKP